MSARRFAPLGFVQTRRELLLKLRLNKKKQIFFFFKTAGPICETCERVPCSCRDRGEDIVCWGGGEVVAQGVGVNYANKCSDTNLDEDSVKEELAEGGIVRMMAAAAAVVGGASPPTPPPPSPLLALYLEAAAYLICPAFFFFLFKRSVRINISTSAIVLPLKIILSACALGGRQSAFYQVSEYLPRLPPPTPYEMCF